MGYVLGVIGGTGMYDISGLTAVAERAVSTPYGEPSDAVVRGRLGETVLLFLPRHGRGHHVPPHAINYRANIYALKILGATHVVSVSAVGSMRSDIDRGHVVVVDQYIDLTRRRVSTFFDSDVVAHVGMADPVCPALARACAAAAIRAGATVHEGGTYVCIDGPQFSTRAESQLYRSWGVSVIGMTSMPEAKLAREAELPYATLAFSTDYDCWHTSEEDVGVAAIVQVLRDNADLSKRIVKELASALPDPTLSPATGAVRNAIMTAAERVTPATRARLPWLFDRTHEDP
ncbi:MAG: S-methyl-5'-thioadenosine phosphorylase [Polyangiaceae bacterium]|nr:S-methyl-5'-thioadenosine phosphorylase [Polyangiaceae bacterium]